MEQAITPPRWLVFSIVIVSLLIITAWSVATPDTVHGKADAVGYAICHRIPDRSFQAFGRVLPLCARCTGIYLGVMTGLAVYVLSGRGRAGRFPPWQLLIPFGLIVTALVVDGTNSYFHLFPGFDQGLYEPNNTLRLITGIYCGLAFITLVLPLFNSVVWRFQSEQRILENWREFVGLLIVATLVLGATLTRQPYILLFFGYLSALGVVIMLTMINSVMVISLLRTERRYLNIQDLWLPLLGGAGMAFALIGAIDAIRFAITGTWDGFNFPTV